LSFKGKEIVLGERFRGVTVFRPSFLRASCDPRLGESKKRLADGTQWVSCFVMKDQGWAQYPKNPHPASPDSLPAFPLPPVRWRWWV